ncbi:MAG: hypothetical protein M3460_21675 [Actinomycetota bacterium]|nr:hypothetical protein [Actinomycetota bacterium]
MNWLQTHPGDSWQQRWQASGAEDQLDWRDMITAASVGRFRASTAPGKQLPHLSPGLLVLICADVIRPSLGWLLRFAPARRGLVAEMARTRDAAAFAALTESCTHARVGLQTGQQALTRVAVILAAKGGSVAEVRVGDCVELLQVTAGLRATSPRRTPTARCFINCCARRVFWARTPPPRSRCSAGVGSPAVSS